MAIERQQRRLAPRAVRRQPHSHLVRQQAIRPRQRHPFLQATLVAQTQLKRIGRRGNQNGQRRCPQLRLAAQHHGARRLRRHGNPLAQGDGALSGSRRQLQGLGLVVAFAQRDLAFPRPGQTNLAGCHQPCAILKRHRRLRRIGRQLNAPTPRQHRQHGAQQVNSSISHRFSLLKLLSHTLLYPRRFVFSTCDSSDKTRRAAAPVPTAPRRRAENR